MNKGNYQTTVSSSISYSLGDSSLTEEEYRYIKKRTAEDCYRTAKKDCLYCKYSNALNSSKSPTNITCNYICMTGHMRPCLPGKCREAGVFKKVKRQDKEEGGGRHYITEEEVEAAY